ncbi:BON domain-containing protein [bacterium endosymbiont of Pedicinus badii]|uniref:BON domain-containing protein n=1 Tax=bacterium endosymbiont of Pedicinus badii TaxID=1719126 RepID=UPI0009B9645B|nr:BON domain-containing protein [bacterium endosymbiont of Pedicinus badii]OQM34154.1 hypothetical protein AOQ89_02320 [bacterium endosymbiont of Pedicinus badii]
MNFLLQKKIFFILLFLNLCGCISTTIISSATIIAKTSSDSRSLGEQIDDFNIRLKVLYSLSKDQEIKKKARIISRIYKKKIILAGQAESYEILKKIVKKIRNIQYIKTMHNQIRVQKPISKKRILYDSLITAKIYEKFFFSKERKELLKIIFFTENQEVFLFGYADQKIEKIAVQIINRISKVKKIIVATSNEI